MKNLDADGLIAEIRDTLSQWDGESLVDVAVSVLGHPVTYDGDSMFTVHDGSDDAPEQEVS